MQKNYSYFHRFGYSVFMVLLSVLIADSAVAYPYKRVYVKNDNSPNVKSQNVSDVKQVAFDRKFYVGLGASTSVLMLGKISSEYKNNEFAWMAAGSFNDSNFKSDSNYNLHVLVGGQPTKNTRIEFAFTHISGISMDMDSKNIIDATDNDGKFKLSGTPELKSNVAMLNLYYYLDSIIGTYKLRPYVGAGAGLAINTMPDYTVNDYSVYIMPGLVGTLQPVGTPISLYNIDVFHKGNTKENLAYSVEIGATYALSTRTLIDIFGRYVNLGKFESEGITSKYTVGYSDSDTIPVNPPTNYIGDTPTSETSYFPDWKESGNLGMFDLGIKLRFLF